MPHIPLPETVPGILSLFHYRPETAKPLNELAELLLRGPSTLSRGERETIAAFVSSRNDCFFCESSHSAFARAQLTDPTVVEKVKTDLASAPVSGKLKALLRIAERVQQGGKKVTGEVVAAARAEGASDREIHDTVLIAAAFCMFNRYVDGLATLAPTDTATYDAIATQIVQNGYVPTTPPARS
jgi:uncharacterized peroxidase-related enzyme